MLLVTHDIDEAIYMSDRIVIMTASPGRIERHLDIVLDRPRQRNSAEFMRLRASILEHLHFAGQTARDPAVSAAAPEARVGRPSPGAEIPQPLEI
jgi:ABC-type taurine transport system ATPase subunit